MRKFLLRIVAVILSLCLVGSGVASAVVVLPFTSIINLCGIIDSDGADRTGWQIEAANWLENVPNASVNTYAAFNSTQLENYLKESNVFVVHTHGSPNLLKAVDSNGHVTFFNRSQMDRWASGSLSSVQLAFFAACRSGEGAQNEDNFVNSAYALGADCVIGYTESVYTNANYIMVEEFCKAIGAGYSIAEALVYADTKVLERYGGSTGETHSRYILGDTSVRFTDNIYFIGSIPEDTEIMSNDGNEVTSYLNFDKITVTCNDSIAEANFVNEPVTKFLDSICKDASRYTLTQSYYAADTNITTYIYTYRIAGVDTGDYVYIMLNPNNDIVAWGKPNEGAYDSVTLTEEDIQNTAVELRSILSSIGHEEYSICDKRLLWNDGVLMIRYSVRFASGDVAESIADYYLAIGQEVR